MRPAGSTHASNKSVASVKAVPTRLSAPPVTPRERADRGDARDFRENARRAAAWPLRTAGAFVLQFPRR
jgi:hypothetical protein